VYRAVTVAAGRRRRRVFARKSRTRLGYRTTRMAVAKTHQSRKLSKSRQVAIFTGVFVAVVLYFFGNIDRHTVTDLLQRGSLNEAKDRWVLELHKLSRRKGPKSQGAQDFYFEQIFANIGTTNRYFVEFGFNEPTYTSGGSGANTWNLYDSGWRGLLLDGARENAAINLHAHYLFEQNIASIFNKYEVPKELDLLSCDMDSHDIFVLRGILNAGYRPRVFTTEYNSNYPLEYAIALIDPTIIGADVSAYDFSFKGCAWGASASALRIVAEKFGYTLVGRVSTLDLVWLRNDLIEDNWEVPAFEWFFEDAPLGTLHHHKQTSNDIVEYLVDFNVLEKTGVIQEAKEAARVALEDSDLACFSSL